MKIENFSISQKLNLCQSCQGPYYYDRVFSWVKGSNMSLLELDYIIILWKEFHESLIMTLPSVMHSVMLALSERMLMEFQAKNKQTQNTKR
jgi:hypothetical protein